MYGFEAYGVVPDFLVLSKTLGGGIPIGAVVTSATIEEECHARGFMHVTSHVSDPLPAAAALAVLDVVREEDLPARARAPGRAADRPPARAAVAPRGDRRRARDGPAVRASSSSRTATRGARPMTLGRRSPLSATLADCRSTWCAAAPAGPRTASGWRHR